MQDKLVAIPNHDLPNLRDLFKANWPANHVGYYTLDNYIRWFNQDPKIPSVIIYSLNGDWSDGTFIIIDRQSLFLSTLNEEHSRLSTALSLVDFSRGLLISSFIEKLYETVWNFVKSQNLQTIRLNPTKWYFLPRSEGSKFVVEPRENIILKPLSIEHAAIANDLWHFKHPGSWGYVQRLAKHNISYGAFTNDDELVAWCLRQPTGALGILEVTESYKRKGIGSLLVKAMAKVISDSGDDVCSPVVIDNYISQNMFEKLGFVVVDTVHWLKVTSSVFEEFKD